MRLTSLIRTLQVDTDFEKKRDLILWILKHVGTIEGRTRFQKMVFLGQQELGLPKTFQFSKSYYGPYSIDLADIIEELILHGDIVEEVQDTGFYIKYSYALRDEKEKIKDFKVDKKEFKLLKGLATAPLKSILAYVYQEYCPQQKLEIPTTG